MHERERLYRDLATILGGETEEKEKEPPGIYISPIAGFVLFVFFTALLVWVGADLFHAVHATPQ